MVRAFWKESLTAWVFSALYGLYDRSLFRAVLARVGSAFKDSRIGSCFRGALLAPQFTRTWYGALLGRFNALLGRIGSLAGKGIIAAFLRMLGRFCARVTRGSFICAALARFGVRRILLLIFALYLPLDVLLRTAGLPPVVSSLWDEALLGAMLLYALYDTAKTKSAPRITPIDSPFMLCFAVGVFLMMVISPAMFIAVDGFRAVFQYMLFYPALVRLVKNERDLSLVTLTILGTGVILAFHGIYQYIVAAPIPEHWVSMSEAGVRTRAFSIVGSPNILGDFMIMTAPIAVAMAYRVQSMKSKIFFWGCFAVIGLCCLFTFSRGAWIGLVAAAVIFSLMVDRRLFALIVIAGVAALLVPEVSNRLGYLFTPEFQEKNEAGGRNMWWQYGMELLNRKNPLLGVGLGGFGGAVAMHNQVMPGVTYFYLDNYYVKTLVEMGYVGLVSYISLLASSLWMGLRSFLRCATDRSRVLTAGLFAAVCGVLIHCFFENIFEVPYMNAYFWGFVALLACRGFVIREKT